MSIWLISLLWALAAGGLAWYCGRSARQITYVTLADGRQQERRLPISFRLLLPLAPNLMPYFERERFSRVRDRLGQRLRASGFEALLTPSEFMALRVLFPVVVGAILVLLIRLYFGVLPGRIGLWLQQRQLLFHLLAVLLAALYPGFWLKRALAARHRAIARALPFVIDLLTLSVEAGLDFMTSIQRIVERRKVDALGEELIRVFREVQLGSTRRVALRSLAERVAQLDLRSVVNALVQADELGVSIGAMLRIQADQIRTRRFQQAEKLANEAPVKLLFPLVVLIFPTVFIVLLGPVIMQLVQHGL